MAPKTKEYQKGYKEGYEQALDDAGVIHGKAAERFLAEMKKTEEQGPSEKQKKFLKECEEMVFDIKGQ